MTLYVTMVSMTQRFALITLLSPESELLLGEGDQIDSPFMARKMENSRPNQDQGFTGCCRNVAEGMHAGARGEGAAKVRAGEVG